MREHDKLHYSLRPLHIVMAIITWALFIGAATLGFWIVFVLYPGAA